jgi:DNA-directed RNA polymerase III subunit RPC1
LSFTTCLVACLSSALLATFLAGLSTSILLRPCFQQGVSDKSSNCETCHQKMADCVGHYAYIKLVLPVFHIGYFKQTITMLQDICKVHPPTLHTLSPSSRSFADLLPGVRPCATQTCAHVMLSEDDRRTYLARFRRPNLENLQRQAASKAVNTLCRKVVHCPHCGATNGTVKKIGALKIVHEKYRAKKVGGEHEEFLKTFGNAVREDAGLRAHVRKAQEDLNPLRVLELFKRISAEVRSLPFPSPTSHPGLIS